MGFPKLSFNQALSLYDNPKFSSQVQQLVAVLADEPDITHSDQVVLSISDSAVFGLVFTALAVLGKKIVLPHNNSPEAVLSVCPQGSALLADLPLTNAIRRGYPKQTVVCAAELTKKSATKAEGLDMNLSVNPDQIDIVVYTSGSTGVPKSIRKPLRAFVDEVNVLEQLWGRMLGGATVLATVSHQHVYGLLFRFLWPTLAGRPMHTELIAYPEQLISELEKTADCVLVSSPAFLSRLHQHITEPIQAKGLKRVFSSGGPLFEEDNFRVQSCLQTPIIEVFGSSETGGVAYRQLIPGSQDKRWKPLPTVHVQKNPTTGCLQVQSPFLFTDGWYEMGDLADIEGNHFILKGRTDRIVKIEEKRVSLTAIEKRLVDCNEIAQARLIVLEKRRKEIAAVVILSDEGKLLLDQIGKWRLTQQLRERMAPHFERVALPRKWRFVDSYPYNTQGKVTEQALSSLFDQQDSE